METDLISLLEIENSFKKFVTTQTSPEDQSSSQDPIIGELENELNLKSESEHKKSKDIPKLNFIEPEDEIDILDRNNLSGGTYYLKNGKLIKGVPEQRSTAMYSNWHGGNVDPQDLMR